VRRYRVRLELRAARVPSPGQVEALSGGRHQTVVASRPRSRRLEVQLTLDGVDVVGVMARATHHVLDRIPGEVVAAEVAQVVRPVRRPSR
jgi:hypothetical protein